ncbi:hypothetical protein EDD18DRAFT_1100445 [Armillaria luteobubalina]|uniref:Uncharacterized protein n=1 Tax=Armillaria luteobubalina TaxID=153913 RepID=A0AA39USW0_9AGAR|nr:hypothetical protein EDD18DRAFT_1100445 [Armillaria luteobubalina]
MADTPINRGPDRMHECNRSILSQNEHSHHMTDENMVIFQEQGTVSGRKRCLSHEEDGNAHKRVCVEGTDVRLSSVQSPEGLEWSNNSYAYDAMLSILYNVWKQDTARWVADFERLNKEWLKALSDLFRQHRDNEATLEEARDKFRRGLARRYPDMIRAAVLECPEGHHVPNACINNNSAVFVESHSDRYSSVREWLHEQWNLTDIRWRACRICNNRLRRRHVWIRAPEILAFTSINGRLKTVDEKLVVVVDGVQKQYGLSGTIYHGQEHFTARVFVDGRCWFHDGLTTGRELILETQDARLDMTRCRVSNPLYSGVQSWVIIYICCVSHRQPPRCTSEGYNVQGYIFE